MVADTYEIDASTGDRLLLCSDGLTGMLEDARIAELLGGYSDPGVAASELVAAANEAGGHDNVSVIVVDIRADSNTGTGVRETDRSLRGWISVAVWVLAAAAIVAAAGYGAYRYAITRAYVVSEAGTVSVYRGVPGELAGIQLRWLVDTVQVDPAALSMNERTRLEAGVRFDSTSEALRFAESLQTTSPPAQ